MILKSEFFHLIKIIEGKDIEDKFKYIQVDSERQLLIVSNGKVFGTAHWECVGKPKVNNFKIPLDTFKLLKSFAFKGIRIVIHHIKNDQYLAEIGKDIEICFTGEKYA